MLDCHNPTSQRIIRETLTFLEAGGEERLISEDGSRRGYMRAVRDPAGRLLGYYERYECMTNGGERCPNDSG
ncbi:MAG TPA: hypothetical protein G4O00_14785 [Thermoflexia bacterium]|nr:hypothetical protein [Thermoflexia bacterium]